MRRYGRKLRTSSIPLIERASHSPRGALDADSMLEEDMSSESVSLYVLPVLAGLIPFLSSVCSYVLVVGFDATRRGVYGVYPTEMLDRQPVRGLFSAGLATGALLTSPVVLLRHVQMVSQRRCRRTSIVSTLFGIVMCIGEGATGCFSLRELPMGSYLARSFFFGAGLLFMITQLHITRVARPTHSLSMVIFRSGCVVLTTVCIAAYVLARVYTSSAHAQFLYIPIVSEWTLLFLHFAFLISFACDLIRFRFVGAPVQSAGCRDAREANYIDHFRAQASGRKAEPDLSSGRVAATAVRWPVKSVESRVSSESICLSYMVPPAYVPPSRSVPTDPQLE